MVRLAPAIVPGLPRGHGRVRSHGVVAGHGRAAGLSPPGLQARTLAGVARAATEARRNHRWRGWSTRMLALAAAVVVAAGLSIGLLSGGTPGETYALALHSGPGGVRIGQRNRTAG